MIRIVKLLSPILSWIWISLIVYLAILDTHYHQTNIVAILLVILMPLCLMMVALFSSQGWGNRGISRGRIRSFETEELINNGFEQYRGDNRNNSWESSEIGRRVGMRGRREGLRNQPEVQATGGYLESLIRRNLGGKQ